MKKWIVLLLVLGLAFVGCTKQAEQNAPEEAAKEAVEPAKEAVEPAKEAVEPAKEAVESAQEAVPEEAAEAKAEDPDVKSCLQLVSEAKFADALPVCLAALKKHPDNDEVKGAVEKAQQAAAGDAAAAATDAAQDAQEEAVGKTHGAMDEATGNLPH